MRKDVIEAQIVLGKGNVKRELGDFIRRNAWKKIFLVAGKSFSGLAIGKEFAELEQELSLTVERFSAFSVNPEFSEAVAGSKVFRSFSPDVIFAVGGGSAMDTAKAIKLFSSLEEEELLLKPWKDNGIPLLAIPTTAGTGSECTPFSVLYKNGEKLSIEDESIYPLIRVEDARSLEFLPLYQKKVTLLDALSHAMESIWSRASEGDNLYYGKEAIDGILRHADAYLENDPGSWAPISDAATLAGKAIAITKTTGGHALSYKLGSLFSLPHGLATAIVNKELYPLLTENEERVHDPEKLVYLAHCFGAKSTQEGADCYRAFLEKVDVLPKERQFYEERLREKSPDVQSLEEAVEILAKSVNLERLQNHPMSLSEEELKQIYRRILMLEG